MKLLERKVKRVATTLRLHEAARAKLDRLRIELHRPIQAIVEQAVEQYEQRRVDQTVSQILKQHTVGQLTRPFNRSDLYEEHLNHKLGTPR